MCLGKRDSTSRGNRDENLGSGIALDHPPHLASRVWARLMRRMDLQQPCAPGGSKFGQIGCCASIKDPIPLLQRVEGIFSNGLNTRSYIIPNQTNSHLWLIFFFFLSPAPAPQSWNEEFLTATVSCPDIWLLSTE